MEAGHWVTDRVRRFVNETYTAIRRVPRQVTEKVRHVSEWIEKVPRTVYDTVSEWVSKTVPVVKTVYDTVKETAYRTVQKPVQIVKQVAETVWDTGTRLVDKTVPVVRQVTDYVTEKVKDIIEVPRTIYDTVVNVIKKTVPVVKDIAYTAYEKAERIVDKVFEIAKQVPKTIYKEITEKVVQPTVETYQIAVEKFKDVKEYVIVKAPQVKQVSRTVYDEVKVPVEKNLVIAREVPIIGQMIESEVNKIIGTTGLIVGAVENVAEVVSAATLLAYNLAVHPKITTDVLLGLIGDASDDPVGAVKSLGEGYADDVKSKWGDGSSKFNQGRAAGYVLLDVVTLGWKKAAGEIGEKVAKEVGEKVSKKVTEKVSSEVAERTIIEFTEGLGKESSKVVRGAVELAIKETKGIAEKKIKKAMDKAVAESSERIAKEMTVKIAKATEEAAKKAAEKLRKVKEKAEKLVTSAKTPQQKKVAQKKAQEMIKEAQIAAEETVKRATKKAEEKARKEAEKEIAKVVREAGEKATKEMEKEMEKIARETAKATKQKLLATTVKVVESAAQKMTAATMSRFGLKAGQRVSQPFRELEQIIKKSKEAKLSSDPLIEAIAKKTNGEAVLPDLKTDTLEGYQRAVEKAAKYAQKFPDGGAHDVTDIYRKSLVYEDMGQLNKGLEALGDDFKIVDIEDRISFPQKSGYRDIKVLVQNKNGIISEVQLLLREVYNAKKIETKIYNQVRVLDETIPSQAKQIEILREASQKIYNQAWEEHLLKVAK